MGADKLLGMCIGMWMIWELTPLAEIRASRREVKVWNRNLKDEIEVWPRTRERIVQA